MSTPAPYFAAAPSPNEEGDVEHVSEPGVAHAAHARPEDTPLGPSLSRKMSIPVDHFDPEGTDSLRRTLSKESYQRRMSASGRRPSMSTVHRARSKSIVGEPGIKERPETADSAGPSSSDDDNSSNKFDLEDFLSQVMTRGREAGKKSREMGVWFQDLSVSGVGAGVSLSSNVLSTLLTPFDASLYRRAPVKNILTGFTGTIRPGEMVLVLGRPGAGCTSFLKTLASYRDGFRSVDGQIGYGPIGVREVQKKLRAEVAYLPEDDIHFPTMTVSETLSFAAAARAPDSKNCLDGMGRKEFTNTLRDVLMTVFGLRHTAQTKVGNDYIRGVSGGERKRVSVAEILAVRSRLICFDNSTRGLDASTAVEFVRALRIASDLTRNAIAVSIYQAGEQLYKLFDKVAVINQGHLVFYGPADAAVTYFTEMGFRPHDRQTTADFLVSVTDPKGRLIREGYESHVPRTPADMARRFEESEAGRRNRAEAVEYSKENEGKEEEMEAEYKRMARAEKSSGQRKGSAYVLSYQRQVALCILRRAQIVKGDIGTHLTLILAAAFQSIIQGSVFYQMPKNTSGFFSRGGVIFFALLYNAFTAATEINAGYSQRPIVIRHKRFAMVHPSADALANTLLDMPMRFLNVLVFDIVLYFMSGMQYTAGQFFIFLCYTLLATYTMVSFFRALAASMKAESSATTVGGLAVLDLATYAGYIIPKRSMHPWFKWLTYINPISWAFEALMANEFRTLNVPCGMYVPSGPGYEHVPRENQVCPIAGAVPGQPLVSGEAYINASFGYSWSNAGRNAGIMIAFWVFFMVWYWIASEWQTDPKASGGVIVFHRSRAPKVVKETAKGGRSGSDEEKTIAPDADPMAVEETSAQDKANATNALSASSDIFSWDKVNYDVVVQGKTRRLLQDVKGYVAPGKLTALMGESGAGKTTLLNVLAQRVNMGVVTGDMLVNGKPLPKSFQASVGYCQQQDVHLSTATVREALQFSALLRQPASTPKQEKLAYVEDVIKMLEMEPFAEAMVGEVGEGLSVEQRKLLTIGVELAAKPELLLFLDEPTSGLDSQSAWAIVSFLRKLADHGQAILCTIHQPSGEVFSVFDRLLLLQKGGKTVYFGDIGKNASQLVDYFQTRSGQICREEDNPAEYMLDVIGAGATASTKHDWHELWKQSELKEQLDRDLDEIYATKKEAATANDERADREYAASFTQQFVVVTHRVFTSYWRNPVYVLSKLALNVLAGLFVGFSFWKLGRSITDLQNMLFACFMSIVLSTSLSQQLQPMLISLRALYEVRERPSKMYNWVVATLSWALVEIPWNLFAGTLFFVCWYWTCGFPLESARVGYHWGFYMLYEIYFASFAQAIAVVAANSMIASILFSTFFSFVIVMCGVVQPPPQLPYFWRSWMFPLSPFTYLIEGFLGSIIGGKPIVCKPQEFAYITPPAGQTCQQYLGPFVEFASGYFQDGPNGTCAYCQFKDGDEFLATVDMSASHKYRNIGIIVAYIAFNFFLLFFLMWALRVHKWKKGEKAVPSKAAGIQVDGPVGAKQELPAPGGLAVTRDAGHLA